MISAKFKIVNPDDVICDLGARMTLGQWKAVRKALAGGTVNNASTNFVSVIDGLIAKAEEEFTADGTVEQLKQAA